MITKIILRNFQCYKKLTIDFRSPVFTLCGESDLGKSAILRAIRWVFLNQPDGDSFIRDGAKSCKVTVIVDDHKVVRKKGKGINAYWLDGKRFVSFGRGVPDPIAQVLHADAANFQNQIEPPYWFTESPSQISKNLNQIVNLGVMGIAMQDIASRIRENNTTYRDWETGPVS